MMTYYITGLGGFVGKNLLEILDKEKDCNIVAFILPQERNLNFLNKQNITLVEGNLLSKEDIHKFLSTEGKGNKIIIHIAGRITTLKRGDSLTTRINYEGTKNIVDVMNEIGDFSKLVYVSSVDSLPKQKGKDEIKETEIYDIKKVDGVYSKSKVLANNYVLENSKVSSTLILPSAILGPNDPRLAPINNAIKKFLIDKLPMITAGGYNLVDVRDVAQSIYLASKSAKDKESYIVSGEYISVKDLIKEVADIEKKKPVTKKVPHFFIKLISPFIVFHAKIHHKTPLFTGFSMDCLKQNSNYSNKKAKADLGITFRPLKETLIDTVKWMKESGYLAK